MKRSLFLLIIAVLISFAVQAQNAFPSFELKKLNGSSFNTSGISNDGKPIIILVWELSCKPCLQEFDNITKLYAQWQKETGVKIVAISVDDNRNYSKVSSQVRSKGWPFEFYQDKNQEIKRAMGIQYCPFALVLDGKRQVRWRKGGYTPGDETVMHQIVEKISRGEDISEKYGE